MTIDIQAKVIVHQFCDIIDKAIVSIPIGITDLCLGYRIVPGATGCQYNQVITLAPILYRRIVSDVIAGNPIRTIRLTDPVQIGIPEGFIDRLGIAVDQIIQLCQPDNKSIVVGRAIGIIKPCFTNWLNNGATMIIVAKGHQPDIDPLTHISEDNIFHLVLHHLHNSPQRFPGDGTVHDRVTGNGRPRTYRTGRRSSDNTFQQ